MNKKKNVWFSLTDEDVQNICEEILGRQLDLNEMAEVQERATIRINWYDAIEEAINEKSLKQKVY